MMCVLFQRMVTAQNKANSPFKPVPPLQEKYRRSHSLMLSHFCNFVFNSSLKVKIQSRSKQVLITGWLICQIAINLHTSSSNRNHFPLYTLSRLLIFFLTSPTYLSNFFALRTTQFIQSFPR